jgi:lysophospholipase L1-like esterase
LTCVAIGGIINKKQRSEKMKEEKKCTAYISILGDSISTYDGYSNNGDIIPSLSLNKCFYRHPFPLEKTYWSILCQTLGFELLVNNSYSGGNLSGRDDPTSGLARSAFLARDGITPDLIILFMGTNDLGRGIDSDIFVKDYKETLSNLNRLFPDAKICCVTVPDRDPVLKPRAELFNLGIRSAALDAEACFIADLFNSRLNNDFYYMNTLDGLHPDEDGMKIIAEIICTAILHNMHN